MRRFLIGLVTVVILGAGGLYGWSTWRRAHLPDRRPQTEAIRPLEPVTRGSTIVLPVAVTLNAIQDAVNKVVPRNFAGSQANPLPTLLKDSKIDFSVDRGDVAVSAKDGALVLAAPLTGSFHIVGRPGGAIAQGLGNLLGGHIGQQIEQFAVDQTANIHGLAAAQARPQITPQWRIVPNITPQVALGDVSLPIAGARVSLTGVLQPQLNRLVAGMGAQLEQRLAQDPRLKAFATEAWQRACRSFPLPSVAGGPTLYAEVRPTGAVAAQPRIDGEAVHLVLGLQAQTRVTATQSTPSCPFPETLSIVPAPEAGQIALALPIDVPFTDINTLLTKQLIGKTFPEDGSGPVAVTVKAVKVTPSLGRLLVALDFVAKERRFLGLEATGTAYVWGKPALDAAAQMVRLADVQVDVDSADALGLIGIAASAAGPYLEQLVAEKAVIDLKPFATDARQRIEEALKRVEGERPDLKLDLQIKALTLAEIAFDANVLRIVTEAEGTIRLGVSALPLQ